MLALDPRRKISVTIDAIFGNGISDYIPIEKLEFVFSKRTGKIRHVIHDGKIILTLRTDGGLALTIHGARLLLQSPNFRENCIVVRNDVAEFIGNGKSVFCKHVLYCGNNIRVGSEVAVLNEDNEVIAVGKAALSAKMIREFRRGVAVKVR